MIDILNKWECCGCEACSQVCPTSAITMEHDSEGFLYPKVNVELCVECGRCEGVCPVIHPAAPREAKRVYAAYSADDTLRAVSSSGGVFSLLATQILRDGGVVVGAHYNEKFEVEHVAIDDESKLAELRGSKYSQSRIGDIFVQVATALRSERKLLFVGTPCQVAGLKRYLGRDYENLYLADFICHGVPSPMVWSRYLEYYSAQNDVVIERLSHRDKSQGWRRYSFAFEGRKSGGAPFKSVELFTSNLYSLGYLKDLYLRPSCYKCPTRAFGSGSDITVADFWSVEKLFKDDDKGCSMVIPFSQKGVELFSVIDCVKREAKPSMVQRIAYSSPRLKRKRQKFFEALAKGEQNLEQIIEHLTAPPLYKKITRGIRKYIGI